jgi:hypothetical protein
MISQALHSGSAVGSAGALINGEGHHSSAAMQASVLALNRNFSAVHVLSVRRAFCLIFKELGGDPRRGRSLRRLRLRRLAKVSEPARSASAPEHDDFIRPVNFDIRFRASSGC